MKKVDSSSIQPSNRIVYHSNFISNDLYIQKTIMNKDQCNIKRKIVTMKTTIFKVINLYAQEKYWENQKLPPQSTI